MSLVVIGSLAAGADQAVTTVPVIIKLIVFSSGSTASTLVIKDDTTVLATFNGAANAAPASIPLGDGWGIPTKLTVTVTGTAAGAVIFK